MMGEGNLTWENGVTTTNNGTGGAAMMGLTEGAFFRDLVKFGSETVNFVNRNELCGTRWRE